jgi:2-dehydropantoate 2-reductase
MSYGKDVFVIGGGAIGMFFAYALEKAKREVQICTRSPVGEFVYDSGGRKETLAAKSVSATDGLEYADWIILATKAQDTPGAAAWLSKLAGPQSRIIIAQNGIDHRERLPFVTVGATIIPALVFAALETVGRGYVRHHSGTRVDVPEGPAVKELTKLFEGSPIDIRPEPDFKTATWRKLLNNVTGNPITALTLRRGDVFRLPDVQRLSRELLQETVAVAIAEGASLGEADIENVIRYQIGTPANCGTSMLYDRLANRPLETEFITGAVVRAAEKHGLKVPLNRAIFALLCACEGPIRD